MQGVFSAFILTTSRLWQRSSPGSNCNLFCAFILNIAKCCTLFLKNPRFCSVSVRLSFKIPGFAALQMHSSPSIPGLWSSFSALLFLALQCFRAPRCNMFSQYSFILRSGLLHSHVQLFRKGAYEHGKISKSKKKRARRREQQQNRAIALNKRIKSDFAQSITTISRSFSENNSAKIRAHLNGGYVVEMKYAEFCYVLGPGCANAITTISRRLVTYSNARGVFCAIEHVALRYAYIELNLTFIQSHFLALHTICTENITIVSLPKIILLSIL